MTRDTGCQKAAERVRQPALESLWFYIHHCMEVSACCKSVCEGVVYGTAHVKRRWSIGKRKKALKTAKHLECFEKSCMDLSPSLNLRLKKGQNLCRTLMPSPTFIKQRAGFVKC